MKKIQNNCYQRQTVCAPYQFNNHYNTNSPISHDQNPNFVTFLLKENPTTLQF